VPPGYFLGQCLSDEVFDEDELDEDDVDDFDAEGELEAAWAIAVPPPTSAPETARAMSALVTWCRMVFHLPSAGCPVEGESTAGG
jgi:hypothetical protein